MSAQSLQVALAGREYDILIGRDLIHEAGTEIARRLPRVNAMIVTDETVAALHLDKLLASLERAGIRAQSLALKPGEATKNWADLGRVVEAILAGRFERGDIVIAFGGGVIGDLAGFAAAIARRGMRFVQVPTTLLAQVDSSVGGKTGVNSPSGKNLIGAFHQPSLVLADTGLLDTLSTREMRAGYAEVVKYGLIDQPGFYEWLESGRWKGIFSGGAEREEAVRFSCAAKAAVVARDETETGDRALLNLGHTFGHAIEALTHYDGTRIVHGEAVAIGMAQAHRFSARLGLITRQDAVRVENHIAAIGLPVRPAEVPGGVGTVRDVLEAIRQDKKVSRGALTFILTRGIGQSFIAKEVDPHAVEAFLEEDMAE
jgi:3-dehydroquinate synthase